MGLLDNLARTVLYVVGIGTAAASFSLIPVLSSRRRAKQQAVEDETQVSALA
jgi:hypothetical protein